MALKEELGFPNPFNNQAHEALLNVFMTAELMAKEADRILRPYGITESQFNVLMVLKHQSERGESKTGGLSQKTLGDRLVVNRSNVTGLVDRMEKAGWVRRVDDPEDRRVKKILITSEGQKILNKTESVYIARVEEIMSAIKKSEWKELCRMLEAVRVTLWDQRK